MKTLSSCLKAIWQKEGIRGLYKGSLPSIIKAAPSAAVTFSTYEFFLGTLTAMVASRAS
jgi:solute carrier family 25 thiamine pyrophosphate transporter 19